MHTKGTELATGKVSKAVEPLATSCRSLCASSQVPAIVARSLQGGLLRASRTVPLAQMAEDDQEEAEGLR